MNHLPTPPTPDPLPVAELEADLAARRLSAEAALAARGLRGASLSPRVVSHLARIADLPPLAVALWFAGVAAGGFEVWPHWAAGLYAVAGAGATAALASWFGWHRIARLRRFWRAWMATAALTLAPAALAAAAGAPAGWAAAALTPPLALLALATGRAIAAVAAGWLVEHGAFERRAVVIGGGGNAERLVRGLAARRDNDIRLAGFFDDRGDDRSPPLAAGLRKLGTVDELIAFARVARIDLLIVTLPLSAEARIAELLRRLRVVPAEVRLSAYSADYAFPRRDRAPAGLIEAARHPLGAAERAAKRALDLALGSAALVVCGPLMLAAALAVRLDSPGPALFRQSRSGWNNRTIEVLKFRTMFHEQSDAAARRVVTRGDPRVTRVGRWLRKTSIDELPQLVNVLRGDMSLVGPRPHAVRAVSSRQQMFAEIVDGYSARHRAPPGLTGWAQVNGWRGEVDEPEALRARFEHDLWYVENWSLRLDLKILALTPLSLLDMRRAY